MARFLARRLLQLIPTLWGITLVTFLIMHLAPGEPAAVELGDGAISAEALASFRATMGLDEPLHVQYAHWLSRVVRLDFGLSSRDGRPVLDKIADALPHTLLLGALALLLVIAVALPLGIHGAWKPGSALERGAKGALFFLHALPSFFVALLLMGLLCGGAAWGVAIFPMHGLGNGGALDHAWHLVLPVVCLAFGSWATLARQVRASLREVLALDYIRAARAQGISESRVVLKLGLRNALLPAITNLSVLVPALLGGSVVIESIFGIPGLGLLGFQAVTTRDYNTVMGVSCVIALVTLFANLAADLVYAAVDPRTTHG